MSEEQSRADTSPEHQQRIAFDICRRLGVELLAQPTPTATAPPVGSAALQPSIKEWLGKWLASGRHSISERSFVKYRQIANLLLTSLGTNKLLSEISEGDITKFRDSLLESGKRPSTVNLYVKILKSAFKAAVDRGLIARNPFTLVRLVKRQPTPAKGIFTIEQVQRLVEVAEGIGVA